jgi:anti-sigma regulatory factor (Ser/Thr protein kinase)
VSNVPDGRIAHLDLAPLPSAPTWARRHAGAALNAWQIGPDTIETAQLIVSELVTNAIKAANPGLVRPDSSRSSQREWIALTLRLLQGRVVIEVFDSDPAPPVLSFAGADAENGRGLVLVQALAKEWGHYFPPSGGKTVYAVVGTQEPDAHPIPTRR